MNGNDDTKEKHTFEDADDMVRIYNTEDDNDDYLGDGNLDHDADCDDANEE